MRRNRFDGGRDTKDINMGNNSPSKIRKDTNMGNNSSPKISSFSIYISFISILFLFIQNTP